MEPRAADHWVSIAEKFINTGSAPLFDKRAQFQWSGDSGYIFRVNEQGAVDNNGNIQVFKMLDPIAKYDYCGAPGSKTWEQNLSAANADPTIHCTILLIDSPGGQADGTESLAKAIRNSAKPVIAFCDSMMCSAAYWIGSSCSYIIADGSNNGYNATIGSIGTMATVYDDTGYIEKQGYKRYRVFADASSDKWADYFKVIGGDDSDLKKSLNAFNDTFLAAVVDNRSGKLSDKENVFSGKVYNANEALKFGLIDKIGDWTTVVKYAAKAAKDYTKNQKSYNMSTKNNAFQKVLAVANAESFQVVEGGFLLEEGHLNAINEKLDQDSTIIKNLTTANKTLEGQVAGADSSALTQQLNEANARATAAETKVTELNGKVTELQDKLKASDDGKGMFLNESNKGKQDEGGAHEENNPDPKAALADMAHIKEAKARLNN